MLAISFPRFAGKIMPRLPKGRVSRQGRQSRLKLATAFAARSTGRHFEFRHVSERLAPR